jgi:hypothetical protein
VAGRSNESGLSRLINRVCLSENLKQKGHPTQEQVQPVEMRCPKCGGVMLYKGHKRKVV